jgi:DNA (cytosine-5)-methyltransferase 1
MKCVWQVEIDPYAVKILEKHWPDVRRHDNIITFPSGRFADWHCDVICGGFPCQDISNAGKRSGIDGERSGLWSEYSRVIRVLRPKVVVVENSADLAVRGLDTVLGDLAEIGYDAEWSVLSACMLGAPHTRNRMFIVAYPGGTSKWKLWRKRWQEISHTEWNLCRKPIEPEPVRMADGVPYRVDRKRCIGNSVMPQLAELIGRRIVEVWG